MQSPTEQRERHQQTSDGQHDTPSPLLRLPTVMQLTGLGRSTIYRLMASQEFPRPVRISRRAIGWRSIDVSRWNESRPVAAP